MTLAITGKCQRHLRISFFLIMWMCSYIQMIDQLRLDLSDLSYTTTKHIQHNNPLTAIKSDSHEKDNNLVNPFFPVPGKI
jgi:hypothetical protein